MGTHIVVPARLGSTRLPRKPLVLIAGVPMIVRVMDRIAPILCDTKVAAVDSHEVYDAVVAAGYDAQMTEPDHPSGSDRVMEVASSRGWEDTDVVVNVQGDEPLVPADLIARLIKQMQQGHDLATIAEKIEVLEDFENPNIVKVVINGLGKALYFSRSPIPFAREAEKSSHKLEAAYRHVGIYAFRVKALKEFTQLLPAKIEQLEMLEQLRWLDAGREIQVIESTEPVPGGVDTEEDLRRVEAIFNHQ